MPNRAARDILRSVYTSTAIFALRPYIRRELPGWGVLYRTFVGAFERDPLWQHQPERWIRGKLHGYEMSLRISGWSNRSAFFLGRFYDLPTQLLLKRVLRRGDTMIDVGANEGHMTLLAASCVGPEGQVHAFEPNPVPRGILQRALARNGISHVEVHAGGLGDAAGALDLVVPKLNSGEGSFVAGDEVSGDAIECPVWVGDEKLADVAPAAIKIDVEGFELHVLRGLAKTIARARPVVVLETVARHLARDKSTPDDIATFFSPFDYTARRLALTGTGNGQSLVLEDPYGNWTDGDYAWIPAERVGEFQQ